MHETSESWNEHIFTVVSMQQEVVVSESVQTDGELGHMVQWQWLEPQYIEVDFTTLDIDAAAKKHEILEQLAF